MVGASGPPVIRTPVADGMSASPARIAVAALAWNAWYDAISVAAASGSGAEVDSGPSSRARDCIVVTFCEVSGTLVVHSLPLRRTAPCESDSARSKHKIYRFRSRWSGVV